MAKERNNKRKSMNDTILVLQNVSKNYGDVRAMDDISLTVRRGEFLTLLGPSGCGKTTTLRVIAGLETPDAGKVLLDGQDVTALPPNKRAVNTVFQSYALFPHMNVAQNIAYGLKIKGVPKAEIRQRVTDILATVQLSGYDKRTPAQLSGGQRQRVAIARAMVNNPCILLLDEPLGALDLQLRRQMQDELKKLQKQSGITFIYITHDQEEALNMSDRIAIMNGGRFEQIGAPDDIYERPKTKFAAAFVGQANLFEAVVAGEKDGILTLDFAGGKVCVAGKSRPVGETLTLSVRAERLDYNTELNQEGFTLRGTICQTHYAGGSMRTTIALSNGQMFTVSGLTTDDRLPDGTAVNVFWDPKHCAVVGEEEA